MDTVRRSLLAHDSVPAAGPVLGTAAGLALSTVGGHAAGPGDFSGKRRLGHPGAATTVHAGADDFPVSQRDAVYHPDLAGCAGPIASLAL